MKSAVSAQNDISISKVIFLLWDGQSVKFKHDFLPFSSVLFKVVAVDDFITSVVWVIGVAVDVFITSVIRVIGVVASFPGSMNKEEINK